MKNDTPPVEKHDPSRAIGKKHNWGRLATLEVKEASPPE